ncbi:Protein of unknown function [Pyronema omphalodes CBS 100304]|uniref:Uncharacterized protein n=1 Tax=Pyronema omphalodes (strain CBS 100304) TaxID=1076935 RepID=U4LVE6_PYROM|nr:Protein of unknown function [Pyronema omphalodes CBS 100304]
MEFNNPHLLHTFDEGSSKLSDAQPQSNHQPLSTPCHQTTPPEKHPNEYSSHDSIHPNPKPQKAKVEDDSTHTPPNDWNSPKQSSTQYQRARDSLLQKRRNDRIKITPDDQLILQWKEQDRLSWEGISAKLKAKGRWIYTLSYIRQRYNRACRVRRILGEDFVLPSKAPVPHRKPKDIKSERRCSTTPPMLNRYLSDDFCDEVVGAEISATENSPPCISLNSSVARQLFRINPFMPASLLAPPLLLAQLDQESLFEDDNRQYPALVYLTDAYSNVHPVQLIYAIPKKTGIKKQEREE